MLHWLYSVYIKYIFLHAILIPGAIGAMALLQILFTQLELEFQLFAYDGMFNSCKCLAAILKMWRFYISLASLLYTWWIGKM